ncbi:MAG: hypothetical protein Kow0062_22540 [Acidobacteriota bacterium]|nr:MAG: superoxide dismutase family protein [Acidobacteriota bacterium]
MRSLHTTVPLALAILALASCAPQGPESAAPAAEPEHAAAWRAVHDAVAVLAPTEGSTVRGVVRFHENDDGTVTVRGTFDGLNPGQQHAIHVHEFGDCTDLQGRSAGGHFNPEGKPHGLPPAAERHAGDLGNLQADDAGHAEFELTVDNISVAGLRNPILGRAVIVHMKPDDGGQPTGNAGGRAACGAIGIAKAG